MRKRAEPSGIILTEADAAIVKGMLFRSDRQHDVAPWFGVNSGRIAEVSTGAKYRHVEPPRLCDLPPPGPYPAGRVTITAVAALASAKNALAQAEALILRQAA